VEETGHGGRDIMVHKIKDMYGVGFTNISADEKQSVG
jgi:hypothetical protein